MTIGMPGNSLRDLLDHVETERLLAFELVGAMAGADRRRERIATGALHELERFFWIR
jgi:hypothetical protein